MPRYRYYDSGYRYKRYKKHRVRKKYIIAAAVLLALILLIVWLQSNVSGILYSLSCATVRSATAAAVNDAVAETLTWNRAAYDDLVTVTGDGEGNVLSISANAANANLIARQAVTLTSANLNENCSGGVQVPIGAFTGIEWLGGLRPERHLPHHPREHRHLQIPLRLRAGGRQPDAAFRFHPAHRHGERGHALGHAGDLGGRADPSMRARHRGEGAGRLPWRQPVRRHRVQ